MSNKVYIYKNCIHEIQRNFRFREHLQRYSLFDSICDWTGKIKVWLNFWGLQGSLTKQDSASKKYRTSSAEMTWLVRVVSQRLQKISIFLWNMPWESSEYFHFSHQNTVPDKSRLPLLARFLVDPFRVVISTETKEDKMNVSKSWIMNIQRTWWSRKNIGDVHVLVIQLFLQNCAQPHEDETYVLAHINLNWSLFLDETCKFPPLLTWNSLFPRILCWQTKYLFLKIDKNRQKKKTRGCTPHPLLTRLRPSPWCYMSGPSGAG